MRTAKEIIGEYRKVKDEIRDLDAARKPLTERASELEMEAVRFCEDNGLDSMRIDGLGTITIGETPYCTVGDENWPLIIAWAVANETLGMITHQRLSGPRMEEYVADGGKMPPNVDIQYRHKVSFTRSR